MPRTPRPRTVRRAQARSTRQAPRPPPHQARAPRHVRRARARGAAAPPAHPRPPVAADLTPREGLPLHQSVYRLLRAHLPPGRYSKPGAKRLAVLVSGLVASATCGLGDLERTVAGLAVTPAKPESIGRRLRRLLAAARLDPARLLPDLLATLLPVLLRDLVAKHAASERLGAKAHRARGPLVRVVVDESSQGGHVHLPAVGLAYRGLVLPLLVRTWRQNAPLPAGASWPQLHGLLHDVQALLPPALRAHVLLLADRFYGVPRLLDLCQALGWHGLLRVQDQTRVVPRGGAVRDLRALVPGPGSAGFGRFDPHGPPRPRRPRRPRPGRRAARGGFKAAGWRASQVGAVWAAGAEEPWLLVTSLAPTPARLLEYAPRWGIERLFLSWKSHGWDLEAGGVHDPVRLARLLTGLVLATQWRLAAGAVDAAPQLADLRARARRRPPRRPLVRQPPLPLWAAPPPHAPPQRAGAARPHAAKLSLFSRGTAVCRRTPGAHQTPPVLWALPDWDAPTWSRQAQQVYDGDDVTS